MCDGQSLVRAACPLDWSYYALPSCKRCSGSYSGRHWHRTSRYTRASWQDGQAGTPNRFQSSQRPCSSASRLRSSVPYGASFVGLRWLHLHLIHCSVLAARCVRELHTMMWSSGSPQYQMRYFRGVLYWVLLGQKSTEATTADDDLGSCPIEMLSDAFNVVHKLVKCVRLGTRTLPMPSVIKWEHSPFVTQGAICLEIRSVVTCALLIMRPCVKVFLERCLYPFPGRRGGWL